MSQALYRKYRSKSLDEVVGQSHVTDILSKAIASGRISHAYLFTGPPGVGKTSVARILAHRINDLPYTEESSHLDIIEIDAASNNGVEDVRNLREKVQLAPVSAAKKVYIIDEVHMLSKPAFNALLKTLEEPPEHIVFILATTDLDKLPATIVSRTQRYGFRAIALADAIAHLRHIADAEHIKIDDEALALIASRGDGSFRDSISLLDQLASLSDKKGITSELVEQALGLAPQKVVDELLAAIDAHDLASLTAQLNAVSSNGVSATTVSDQLIHSIRRLLPEKPALLPLLDALLDVPKSSYPEMKLLTILGNFAYEHKHPKTVALATPVLEVSATIEELSKQATVSTPKEPATKKPAKVQPAPVIAAPTVEEEEDDGPIGEARPFDWNDLVEHTRTHYVALYSVLSKCTPDLDGDSLTLFCNNAFYKKKLDDAKYSAHLYKSLRAIGSAQLVVTTLPERPPLKSSQAAAIADIMGGGEEVVLDADTALATS